MAPSLLRALGSLVKNVPVLTYVKVGVAVLLAGTFLTQNYRIRRLSSERDSLKVAVDTAVSANEAQAKALSAVVAQREKDAATIKKLMGDVTRINEVDRIHRRTIADLERTNADVRAYLRIPVPVALRRVLSDEGGDEAGSSPDQASGSTPSAVPAAQGSATVHDFRAH